MLSIGALRALHSLLFEQAIVRSIMSNIGPNGESPLMRMIWDGTLKATTINDSTYGDMFRFKPPGKIGNWIIIGKTDNGATVLREIGGTIMETHLN